MYPTCSSSYEIISLDFTPIDISPIDLYIPFILRSKTTFTFRSKQKKKLATNATFTPLKNVKPFKTTWRSQVKL